MDYDFRLYLLFSSYAISAYFILKSIIIYTRGRKEYEKSFSDISEIVKKDEPKKKEATKSRIKEDSNINKQETKNITNQKNKEKPSNKPSKKNQKNENNKTSKKAKEIANNKDEKQ